MSSSMQTRTHMLRFRVKACVLTTSGGGAARTEMCWARAEMRGRRVAAEVESLWEARDVEVRCAVRLLNCWISERRSGGVVVLRLVSGWGGRLSFGSMVIFGGSQMRRFCLGRREGRSKGLEEGGKVGSGVKCRG